MANIVHNFGLELPVYSRLKRVAWTSDDIRSRANSGAEKFLRRATLRYVGATSLKSALQTADETLERIAEYASIGVIDHTWGLTKRTPSHRALRYDSWRYKNDLIPSGYNLVAEVANIFPLVEPDPELRLAVSQQLNRFNDDPFLEGPRMLDVHIRAVGFHQVRFEEDAEVMAKIIDIDPLLHNRKGI